MKPDTPTRSPWAIATLPVAVAGVALIANAPGPQHGGYWAGYGLIEVASWILLAVMVSGRRAATKHGRAISRARTIVQSLRAQGDRLFHNPGIIPMATDSGCGTFIVIGSTSPPSPLEEWRETVGNKLNHPPFKPGTGDWVLTQHGNRFSDVLDRLREIEAHVEDWIIED